MGREIKRVPLDYVFVRTGNWSVDAHPPAGPGWQLWQTVSDAPISPVFSTADDLIRFMTWPVTRSGGWAHGYTPEQARALVEAGWVPTAVSAPDGMISGAEAAARGLIGPKK